MNDNKIYSFKELRSFLKESDNKITSKPRIDAKIMKDDAKNNTQAVNDIMKETGAKEYKPNHKNVDIYDTNKTTLDVNFAYVPDKEYKDRVKAQVDGFSSAKEEEKAETTDNNTVNKKIFDKIKKRNQEISQKESDDKHAGLKSHNLDKNNFKNKTLFTNENKKMKKLHFKNTVFLSENQVSKKIPDDYKIDGNKFIMEDKNNTQYLVECKVDDNLKGFTQITITKKDTKEQIKEELEKIKRLSSYKSENFASNLTNEERINEDREFKKLIDDIKNMKDNSRNKE